MLSFVENLLVTTAVHAVESMILLPTILSSRKKMVIWLELSVRNHFLYCEVTVTMSTLGLPFKMHKVLQSYSTRVRRTGIL